MTYCVYFNLILLVSVYIFLLVFLIITYIPGNWPWGLRPSGEKQSGAFNEKGRIGDTIWERLLL